MKRLVLKKQGDRPRIWLTFKNIGEQCKTIGDVVAHVAYLTDSDYKSVWNAFLKISIDFSDIQFEDEKQIAELIKKYYIKERN